MTADGDDPDPPARETTDGTPREGDRAAGTDAERTAGATVGAAYEGLLERVPSPACLVRPGGTVVRANEALVDRLGVGDALALDGATIDGIVDERDRAAVAALLDGNGTRRETVHLAAADGPVPATVTATTVGPAEDPLVELLFDPAATHADRYEEVVQRVPDPIYVLDDTGAITLVNDAFVEQFGFDRETLVGEHVGRFVANPEAVVATGVDLNRNVLSGATDTDHGRFEFEATDADGTLIVAETNQTVLTDADGRFTGVVGVLRDVTERDRREDALEQYRRLVETVADPMYRLDTDGTIQMVNEAMVEFLGYDRERLVGTDISAFLSCDAVEEGNDILARLRRGDGDSTGRYEFTVVTEAGEERVVEDRLSLLTDEDGTAVGSVGVVRDVTDRKRRERDLAQYETIIETVPVGLFALDPEGTVVWANEEFYGRLRMTEDELVGTPFLELIDEGYYDPEVATEYVEGLRELLSSGTDTEKITHEVTVHTPAGTKVVDAHMALLPLDDGEFQGTVHAFRDITTRREYQRELERQNDRLEQFASVVSHDLRNPLNVAQGYLDQARSGSDVEAALEEVGVSLARMETLVDDLLTLARQGEAVGDREVVSLPAVVTDAWGMVETGDATLDLAAEETILADRSRVRQLFQNLFQNAMEHATDGPDGTRELTVTVDDLPDGFSVADDGTGIPSGERDDVFELGYSGDADGTGFGLGIVQQIVDAHGWTVEIAEHEAGTRFDVTGVDRPAAAE